MSGPSCFHEATPWTSAHSKEFLLSGKGRQAQQQLSLQEGCQPSKKGFLPLEMFMMSGIRLWLVQCPLLTAV